MKQQNSNLKIITGRSNIKLASDICTEINAEICKVDIKDFANGEISIKILESVRDDDVYVVQSHCGNVNQSIIEQAILIDALKRASAASITAVCPFMAYARQDRKSNGREPISARLLIDILRIAGADRVMSVDLHTGQIQGFFDGPFDHLIAREVFIKEILGKYNTDDIVIVSPDAGRVKSAEKFSSRLSCDLAIIHKHRSFKKSNSVEARHLIGQVKSKICFIVDDMIDTAGTICAAADLLSANGAREVHVVATHGIFSDPALERINKSQINSIITSDTISGNEGSDKIKKISIAPIIAHAILAVHEGGSVSSLFEDSNQA